MKKTIYIVILAMVIALAGCGQPGGDSVQAMQNDQLVSDGRMQAGMPAILNFQELKLAKMIYELRDSEDLVCYAYIVTLDGEFIFLGQCLGYGLPYSVQFSSPERLVDRNGNPASGLIPALYVMPQAEPNALYMPDGLSATWIMLIDPATGEYHPVYCEPQILVSPFPLI